MRVCLPDIKLPTNCQSCIFVEIRGQCKWLKTFCTILNEEIREEGKLKNCPLIPADEIKIGHWIDTKTKGLRQLFKCDLCGGTCYFPTADSPKPKGRFKYCPYCGAKMIKGE